jgi:flagellar assembly protein FliH
MGGAAGPDGAAPNGALLTAAQLEELQRQAREEGFEQGRREGQEYGRREGLEEGRVALLEQLNRFEALMEALDQPFQQLDDAVERDIVTLVISMVRQLVRREIKMDPGHVVGVVREALGVLPVASRNIRVLLHPEDAALVREIYTLGDTEQKWQIVEDPVVARGGCRVLTETSRVDATLESRLNALIAPLLAGERTDDAEQEGPR